MARSEMRTRLVGIAPAPLNLFDATPPNLPGDNESAQTQAVRRRGRAFAPHSVVVCIFPPQELPVHGVLRRSGRFAKLRELRDLQSWSAARPSREAAEERTAASWRGRRISPTPLSSGFAPILATKSAAFSAARFGNLCVNVGSPTSSLRNLLLLSEAGEEGGPSRSPTCPINHPGNTCR